ncbi:MAG: 6-phosphofructokinase, partial [bacterium]
KEDVKRVYEEKKNCLVAVSEGIVNELGEFVFASKKKDHFGHSQLGGVAAKLSQLLAQDLKIATRSVELSSSQRSASHYQSSVDVEEAIAVGEQAVEYAIHGLSDVMVGIERVSSEPYSVKYNYFNLEKCANDEKKLTDEMINQEGNGVTDVFIRYALPLIQGEVEPKYHLGIQTFAKIN